MKRRKWDNSNSIINKYVKKLKKKNQQTYLLVRIKKLFDIKKTNSDKCNEGKKLANGMESSLGLRARLYCYT